MSVMLAIVAFFSYLILNIISSFVLASGISKIGIRLRLAPGLFGLLTALGADAPEISSAIVALAGGNRNLGLSVVFGSNIFNLAILLGLSAVIAGNVHISQPRLILNGAASLLILCVVVGLLIDSLTPWLALVLAGVVFIPYAILVGLHPSHIQRVFPSGWLSDLLRSALTPIQADQHDEQWDRPARWTEMLSVIPALAAIIFSSRGMVNSAVTLAHDWKISHHIVGMLVLSTLTGIPNVVAAIQLALKRRGAAVVSEALNSNTMNLLVAVCLPAIILGIGVSSQLTVFAVWWLLGMTVLALALTGFHAQLSRWGGIFLIILYLVFVGFVLLW